MWRLNVKRQYLQKVFEVDKFFVNKRYEFEPSEPLLLQTLKQDEPGRTIGRIRGILFFGSLIEDTMNESVELYGIKWNYVILPIGKIIQLPLNETFNIEDVIGEEAAKRYYGQTEAVKLNEEDEQKVRERLTKYLNRDR
ncbi:MAG: hypothetical protein N3F06_00275, partial [Nitrososphaerales archaeon]|nr:hypothetical protein [Nitrososphaerales archaeon]